MTERGCDWFEEDVKVRCEDFGNVRGSYNFTANEVCICLLLYFAFRFDFGSFSQLVNLRHVVLVMEVAMTIVLRQCLSMTPEERNLACG